MATLYCDRQVLSIEREGDSILLRDQQGRRNNLPLNLLDRLVIRGTVQMDTSTLARLADKGITVSVLSGRQHELKALVTGGPGKDALRRMGQVRAYYDPAWTTNWSRRLVDKKLRSQQRFLSRVKESRPDRRHVLSKGISAIHAIRERLHTEEPGVQTVLGMEGGAARVYFDALGAILPPSLGFKGRNRRPPRDPVNVLLSLGYTLLHAEAAQVLWASGLDPYIGFYHKPAHARESLAADVIEPLRVHVDRLCWDLCRQRTITADHFSRQGKACMLDKAGRRIFYTAYEERMPPVRRALRRVALTLVKRFTALSGETEEHS